MCGYAWHGIKGISRAYIYAYPRAHMHTYACYVINVLTYGSNTINILDIRQHPLVSLRESWENTSSVTRKIFVEISGGKIIGRSQGIRFARATVRRVSFRLNTQGLIVYNHSIPWSQDRIRSSLAYFILPHQSPIQGK
jgi:hypothetical protein